MSEQNLKQKPLQSLHEDAIRTAEQIRRQISSKPTATIVIGGLDHSRDSAEVALGISKALASLNKEPTVLLDAHFSTSGLPDLLELKDSTLPLIKSLEQAEGSSLTDRLPKIDSNLYFSFLSDATNTSKENSMFSSSENLDSLNALSKSFPQTIVHSIPFAQQESYALLAQADLIVCILTPNESKLSDLEQLQQNCASITDAKLTTLMATR